MINTSEDDIFQDLMPQIGDCIQVLSKHSKDVYGLISTDSNTGFASSSWDGTVMFWAADEHQVLNPSGPAFSASAACFRVARHQAMESRLRPSTPISSASRR